MRRILTITDDRKDITGGGWNVSGGTYQRFYESIQFYGTLTGVSIRGANGMFQANSFNCNETWLLDKISNAFESALIDGLRSKMSIFTISEGEAREPHGSRLTRIFDLQLQVSNYFTRVTFRSMRKWYDLIFQERFGVEIKCIDTPRNLIYTKNMDMEDK